MRHYSASRCAATFLGLLLSAGVFAPSQLAYAQNAPPPPEPHNPSSRLEDDEAELTRALSIAAFGDRVSAAASTNGSGPSGIVPFLRGFNASLGTTSSMTLPADGNGFSHPTWPIGSTGTSAPSSPCPSTPTSTCTR